MARAGGPTRRTRGHAGRRAAALLLLLLAGGCGSEDIALDAGMFSMHLEVVSRADLVTRDDFRERLRHTIEATCAHLGIDPAMLYGLKLRIVDGWIACGSLATARGCVHVDRSPWEIEISLIASDCIEESPLAHELLHVAIYDPHHADLRWYDPDVWGPLWEELRGPDCRYDPPMW